jgi:hypothetical protein
MHLGDENVSHNTSYNSTVNNSLQAQDQLISYVQDMPSALEVANASAGSGESAGEQLG